MISSLEEDQKRTREALEALKAAVGNVESSLDANRSTVAGNVKNLEERVDSVLDKLEGLSK